MKINILNTEYSITDLKYNQSQIKFNIEAEDNNADFGFIVTCLSKLNNIDILDENNKAVNSFNDIMMYSANHAHNTNILEVIFIFKLDE